MAFWALNPGVVFSEIASYSRSIILTSGTLSPLDSYESELQVYFASKLEASHVIDPARFSAMAIECGPSGLVLEGKYNTVDTFSFQDDVGQALCSIASSSPDGMLVFVTSYALLNKLIARWRMTGHYDELNVHKTVFVEPRGGSKDEFEKLLAEYRRCLASDRLPGQPLARGAVMFAVYRGKVSEGIDFSDFFCRTVVNIGIPYPAFKDVKVMLKREYNDQMYRQYQYPQGSSNGNQAAASTGLLNGSKWYDTQAFRAINQALGRCLRHKDDWGAIIMLESRFGQSWNINRLSKWVRQHLRVHRNFGSAMASLDEFYRVRIQEDQLTFAETPDIAEVQTLTGDVAGGDSDVDVEFNAGSYPCI
ncbi:helicase C-terminal domain-containing protein [Kickxella alabastrina]|nr:helicase C-terminal domain-containing protein [Kickxella alabastrina]KAI7824463.1 helicase C-terminal domain-containing protein [Kickxella alabastrina]